MTQYDIFQSTLSAVVQLLSRVRLFAAPWTCSMPGFPVLHHLPEFAQTHIHRVGDAIQPTLWHVSMLH